MKQDALNLYLANKTTKAKLAESYASMVDQVQKGALSIGLKNFELSGDPSGGSVEVTRLMTSASQPYGTARTAGKGDQLNDNKVTINLNVDREIVEEFQSKDLKRYGIGDLIGRRQPNHVLAMIRELDTAFFAEAESAGSEYVITNSVGTELVDKLEELIIAVETIKNANTDGVPRELISVSVTPVVYARLGNAIDKLPNPANGGVMTAYFHGVRIFSNTRQTEEAICMVDGAIAQPTDITPYEASRIGFSKAFSVELFYDYGTKAVAPDHIKYATLTPESL